ncbi:MAG: MGH1-like glycoside hydrolase domain-containing protein [Frankia sp.]
MGGNQVMDASPANGRTPLGIAVRDGAAAVLEEFWRDGYCVPNPSVYPHLWLWDSCFHAISWAAIGDLRAGTELASCLDAQLPHGFVPHMRYASPSSGRGPLTDRSSYTQPPIYAHAARVCIDRGLELAPDSIGRIERALDYLWNHRRTADGLLFIVHPWESGSDDSPRWDDWVGTSVWSRDVSTASDHRMVAATRFDDEGAAVWSADFVVAPAAINAFAGHAASELAAVTGSAAWQRRADELATAIDDVLWDPHHDMWVDQPIVGGGDSAAIPTLDGLMGALVTRDGDRARRALTWARDPDRFAAPYGPRFLPRTHARYRPDQYWRGPAWPQLNYMLYLAARRWDEEALAESIADTSRRGALASGFAEYWNPETGAGLGARPQGWAALAAAYPG